MGAAVAAVALPLSLGIIYRPTSAAWWGLPHTSLNCVHLLLCCRYHCSCAEAMCFKRTAVAQVISVANNGPAACSDSGSIWRQWALLHLPRGVQSARKAYCFIALQACPS